MFILRILETMVLPLDFTPRPYSWMDSFRAFAYRRTCKVKRGDLITTSPANATRKSKLGMDWKWGEGLRVKTYRIVKVCDERVHLKYEK